MGINKSSIVDGEKQCSEVNITVPPPRPHMPSIDALVIVAALQQPHCRTQQGFPFRTC